MTNGKVKGALRFCREGGAGMIRGNERGRSGGLLLALLVFSLLLLSDFALAEEKDDSPAEDAVADTTNQELLLFWEEKELYVQTATRTAKPISQVAENMVVVTAKDIEDMNAHSVAEVLNRVPGLYVDFGGMDFGSTAFTHIQGSANGEDKHISVLLDGVPLNFLSGNSVETSTIPVQIIERIEIIKGPASSAWGSALGGVINIITKNAGDRTTPSGTVSASYGEANSQDYNAQLAGRGGAVGYYLFAGRQQSDGLRDNRSYQRNSLYGKIAVAPRHDLDLVFTAGYSNPYFNGGNDPSPLRTTDSFSKLSTLFVTGSFDYRLTSELSLKGSAYTYRQDWKFSSSLPSNFALPAYAGTPYRGAETDDQSEGGTLKLVYSGDVHTAVLGMDASYGVMDQTVDYGPYVQAKYHQSAETFSNPNVNKFGLFANDTVTLGKFAVTPGIRLDQNNVSGSFVSPSLGATYEFGEHTIARASVARGFTSPPLGYTAGGGFFVNPSPGLKPETVMSYQVGIESAVMDRLNAKATLFRHDSDDELVIVPVPTQRPFKVAVNQGKVIRQGYELDLETVPVYNVSLKAANSFVHIASSSPQAMVNYSYQIGIKYDDRKSIVAQLFGNYVWWNQDASQGAKYDTFIWDATVTKKFMLSKDTTIAAFLSVHNIFSGAYYTVASTPNPGRWLEGGFRFAF